MRVAEFRVKGYDSLTKTVGGGDKRPTGEVFVPAAWKKRRVMVILLDDPDEPAAKKE